MSGQSLFHSKEGKGRGEASCARPALVGNKNGVQLCPTRTECRRFFPWTFLFGEVSLPISPVVCTHCIQRNIGYSFSPSLYCFCDPLKATCTSASQHSLHVMAWNGRSRQEGRTHFALLLRLPFTVEWPQLLLLEASMLCFQDFCRAF